MTAVAAEPKGRAPLNPVLARELRIRLRGRRAWVMLTIYLLLLAGILFLAYTAEANQGGSDDPFSGVSPTQFAGVGRAMFEFMILFMLLLVLFLVPGFTSGAIAGERERQTLVPLQVTLLRPWQIVVGKLTASFAFLALLVVAALPFLGVAYLIGGVTSAAVLQGVVVVLFVGLVVGALTLCCSAVFRRVQIATVVAYAVVLLLLVGTLIAFGAAAVVDESRGSDETTPPSWILTANPLFLAADLLADEDLSGDITSPFNGMSSLLRVDELGQDNTEFGFTDEAGNVIVRDDVIVRGDAVIEFDGTIPDFAGRGQIDNFDEFGNAVVADDDDFPFWAVSAIVLYGLAVGACAIAVRRIRTPASIER